ncbi:MAG: hypothetical protein ABR555_17475, partial [Pyrinomonadaceae bacterium]
VQVIAPTPVQPRGDITTLVPVNVWANGEFADRIDPATYRFPPLADFFVPASLALPYGKQFQGISRLVHRTVRRNNFSAATRA